MNKIIEYACEKCGSLILKTDPIQRNPSQDIPSANKCGDCGHVNDISRVACFQWLPQLRSAVGRLCTREEMTKFRCNPMAFIDALNAKLAAAGKHEVEIDSTTKIVTIREKLQGE